MLIDRTLAKLGIDTIGEAVLILRETPGPSSEEKLRVSTVGMRDEAHDNRDNPILETPGSSVQAGQQYGVADLDQLTLTRDSP